jgi:hexulose-6-phosphate isomerase
MKEIAAYAAEKKVYVGVENVGNKFLLSPLETRDFIDKADCEYVGAYFDCGNILGTGYPDHWIRILGNRIKKIHVKDQKITEPGLCDLLTGDVDYPAVMKALREVGYDGFITAEVDVKPDNEKNLREISEALDKMFAL